MFLSASFLAMLPPKAVRIGPISTVLSTRAVKPSASSRREDVNFQSDGVCPIRVRIPFQHQMTRCFATAHEERADEGGETLPCRSPSSSPTSVYSLFLRPSHCSGQG